MEQGLFISAISSEISRWLEGTTMEDFIKRVKELVIQLSNVGDILPDTRYYDTTSCPTSKLSGKLLLEEARTENDGSQNKALSKVKARKHLSTFYRGQRTYFDASRIEMTRGGSVNFKASKHFRLVRRGHCNNCGVWSHFARECVKSEAFQTFKDFRAMIENETSDGIKTIRKGRRGEFTSREKKTYCTNNGIIHVMVKP
uniref:CCHC-type domain-containing protein n=2 Tax=Physcomitrium patens TaxID=3218 RepID=A0A2K1KD38_PHYPA|nr:hypothetical protein PHYPA_010884 [Physcomitrium patens]